MHTLCTSLLYVYHKESLGTMREIDWEDVNNLLKKGAQNACTRCALLYCMCTSVDHKDSLGAMREINREDVNNLLKKGAYNACTRCALLYCMCTRGSLARPDVPGKGTSGHYCQHSVDDAGMLA